MRTDFFAEDPAVNMYTLMTAVVVPRPIAWVSTVSVEGVVNLAPHSFYTVSCAKPPIIQFSSVGKKDTLRNVLESGEFVVNLAHGPLIELVNNSSARFPPDQGEPERLGILMEPSHKVSPPRVVASPVAIECTLHSTLELGDSTVVFGDVQMISVSEEMLQDGHPDYNKLDPLARLGRDEWARHGDVVAIPRPARPRDILS